MYLDGGDRTVEGQKEFARLAQQMGFEYNIIGGLLEELAGKPVERGRGLLARTRREDPALDLQRRFRGPEGSRDLVDMCNRTGVAGLKIDFWDDEHKWIIDRYERVVKTLAEHKLLVDFHGANKPTGLERTYPNIVGIRGHPRVGVPGALRAARCHPAVHAHAGGDGRLQSHAIWLAHGRHHLGAPGRAMPPSSRPRRWPMRHTPPTCWRIHPWTC